MSQYRDAKLVSIARGDGTLVCTTEDGAVEISFLSPSIARIRLDKGADVAPVSWLAGAPGERLRPHVQPEEPAQVASELLRVSIQKTPFRIGFESIAGDLRVCDLSLARGTGGTDDAGGMSGAVSAPRTGGTGGAQGACAFRVAFRLPGGHHYYGLGHGGQQFDRLGGSRQLWNSHVGRGPGSDIAAPLLVSNRGYAILFDNTHEAHLSLGKNDADSEAVFEASGGPIDFYFIVGGSVRETLTAVGRLVGNALLPPRWYLGYLQSTRHFNDTDELLALGKTLREKKIPTDGLIFLSTYSEALGWNRQVGHLEFQPSLWPDPAAIIRRMNEDRFHVILHEYPVLHPEARAFDEASARGFLLSEGYEKPGSGSRRPADFRDGQRYIDFSNPEAAGWWWEQHEALARIGADGWWLDGGEGPSADAQLRAGDGEALHNAFDRYRAEAFHRGEAMSRPDARPVLLCRSGALGMQRFGAGCWSGDVDNTFKTLAAQVPLGLNTGMSGIPFWGTDIGGFFHPKAETGELFARWFEFGAFCPIFRSHGWVWREHLPWAFGPEVEAICRKYAELRYFLMPYTYTLAWQAASQGLPLMRPLVMNYPDDPSVWDMGDEYLWGDDLLVAPVLREGATRWSLYLPEGSWYDYWTMTRHAGGTSVEVDAPLGTLPLFVRGGAIIPTTSVKQFYGDAPDDDIELLTVPSESSGFTLYDDDGRTNSYRAGAHALTRLSCSSDRTGIRISIVKPEGDAGVIPVTRRYSLRILCPRPRKVTLTKSGSPGRASGRDGAVDDWDYDGRFLRLDAGDCSQGVEIQIS